MALVGTLLEGLCRIIPERSTSHADLPEGTVGSHDGIPSCHHVHFGVLPPRSSRLVTLNHMFEEFINTNMEGPRLASSFLGEQWIPMATENPRFVN